VFAARAHPSPVLPGRALRAWVGYSQLNPARFSFRSVLRHVEMSGLRADEQRTSFGYLAGGAVYLYKSNLTVHQTIFRANAGVWGGAIAMQDAPYAEIVACTFLSNSAYSMSTKAARGGAIWMADSQVVRIDSSEFSSNTAKSGGAVLVRPPPPPRPPPLRFPFPDNATFIPGTDASWVLLLLC
jgi:hypothetical protein